MFVKSLNTRKYKGDKVNKSDIYRIKDAESCVDCNYIPKVKDAGRVFFDDKTGKEYQVMHNGLKVFNDSHYGNFNVEIIKKLKGHHEPQEEKVFFEILKNMPENAIMLELGSFWSYYSMWFMKNIAKSKSYMIEPTFIESGRQNMELNRIDRGEFIEACVGNKSKEKIKFNHISGDTHQIKQISIDDLVKERGIDRIHILHSDIQGAELDMLEGATLTLSKNKVDYILLSTHSNEIHSQCLNKLKIFGYNLIVEHNLTESFSADGLIAMSRNDIKIPKIQISKRKISFVEKIKRKMVIKFL